MGGFEKPTWQVPTVARKSYFTGRFRLAFR